MASLTRERLTAQEYFQLPEYADATRIELIDGEVFVPMPPTINHQDVGSEIHGFLFVHSKQHGGKAWMSNTEIYFDDENIYQPDVIYITPDSTVEIQRLRLVGAPELVVEVLSPSTMKNDRTTKFAAYERHGVLEYWIVDALNEGIQVFVQQETAEPPTFEEFGVFDAYDQFESPLLKVTIDLRQIFGKSIPDESAEADPDEKDEEAPNEG